jgi:pilus assembly protein Flp/PilA
VSSRALPPHPSEEFAEVLKTYIAAKTHLENLKDRFTRDEDGAALIEYTILIGLITVAAIVTIGNVGTWVAGKWSSLYSAL